MMEPKEEVRSYYLLRWYRPKVDEPARYACDTSGHYSVNRSWDDTTHLNCAYHFDSRSDARKTVRSPAFDTLRKRGYYWEVVEITETIVKTYKTAVIVSDAPPLVVLARAAS